jgi:hypothetical protein
MSVRAKFHVQTIDIDTTPGALAVVNLQAVSRGDRNAEWSSATPSGNMKLRTEGDELAMLQALLDDADASVVVNEHGHRVRTRYPEVFLTIADSPDTDQRNGAWTLESVSFGYGFRVTIAKGYGENRSELTMSIQATPAGEWFKTRALHALNVGSAAPMLTITIEPSTDGYLGDGHAFRMSEGYAPNSYYYGKCGICGEAEDRHEQAAG